MRKIMIKSAKEKLARHKSMGLGSSLSILQVAELLDIVVGNSEGSRVEASMSFNNSFSLN